jgi:hypothetical protein
MHPRYCLLLATVAFLTGCGKQERTEAVQFAKTLTQTKTAFASANTIEKEFVSNARIWCGSITASGAGRGATLDQHAAVATELAKSAVAVSAQLSQVRQAIDGQTLKEEFPKGVRNELTTQLTKRQRMLQDMRALLQQSAPQFLEHRNDRSFKGDTYPDGVGKLDALLGSYKLPEDAVGNALASLQKQYSFTAGEL